MQRFQISPTFRPIREQCDDVTGGVAGGVSEQPVQSGVGQQRIHAAHELPQQHALLRRIPVDSQHRQTGRAACWVRLSRRFDQDRG